MRVEELVEIIGADFYSGVPDSQLKALCNYLVNTYGYDRAHHIIAANEGNATALAAGYHLATGKVPVVYMQNSGEGNIINPVASLTSPDVYGIPMVFIIGWRGEPGIHDEPQHVYQGKVTCKILEDMDIEYAILDGESTYESVAAAMSSFRDILSTGKSVAFVVRKGAISYDGKVKYTNNYDMKREDIIEHIVRFTGNDPIISTTGKASRELFEIRERTDKDHSRDFLTVGSMGHASSIAMGVAVNKPERKIWVVDGDGAVLMHMGSMALMGAGKLSNMVHIVINNGAHETVGGMHTVADDIDLATVARGCGYPNVVCVKSFEELDKELASARDRNELSFIEVKCSIGARDDLGRPTTTAMENKQNFMKMLED